MALKNANADKFPVHVLGLAMTRYPNSARPKIPKRHAIAPHAQNLARLRMTRTAPRWVNSTLPRPTLPHDHHCLPVSQSVDVGIRLRGCLAAASRPGPQSSPPWQDDDDDRPKAASIAAGTPPKMR